MRSCHPSGQNPPTTLRLTQNGSQANIWATVPQALRNRACAVSLTSRLAGLSLTPLCAQQPHYDSPNGPRALPPRDLVAGCSLCPGGRSHHTYLWLSLALSLTLSSRLGLYPNVTFSRTSLITPLKTANRFPAPSFLLRLFITHVNIQ